MPATRRSSSLPTCRSVVIGNATCATVSNCRSGIRPGWSLDAACHPRWMLGLLRGGMPGFANLSETDSGPASAQTQGALLSRAMDRTLKWDSLKWVRQHWPGPLLLKGVLTEADARRAVERGVDGVIVS